MLKCSFHVRCNKFFSSHPILKPIRKANMAITFVGTAASAALITLATTGNPVPLQEEMGGMIVSSDKINASLVIQSDEHLAPKALVLEDGVMVAMVAPTITKDNFVVSINGKVSRLDVGHTEGHNIPFVVEDVDSVKDGGASIWEQIGHWFENLFAGSGKSDKK